MSNAIRFLENLGQSAHLQQATRPALYAAMNERQVSADVQWSVLGGDPARLASALHARTSLSCLLMAPEAYQATAFEASVQPLAKAG